MRELSFCLWVGRFNVESKVIDIGFFGSFDIVDLLFDSLVIC